jgi:hypothetical protein
MYYPVITALIWSSSLLAVSVPYLLGARQETMLVDWHRFDLGALTRAYYNRLELPKVVDAARIEQLIVDIGDPHWQRPLVKSYGHILMELMEADRFESFKCLVTLLGTAEGPYYDVYLMFKCVHHRRMEYVEHMLAQGVDVGEIIRETVGMMQEHTYPEWGIDLLVWLLVRNPAVAAASSQIYHDALESILGNGEVGEAKFLDLAKRIIELGAYVDNAIEEACKAEYPENAALHEMLANSYIPDCKEPEC